MGGVIISEPEEGSPIEDLPWVIVFQSLDDSWDSFTCGPYEREVRAPGQLAEQHPFRRVDGGADLAQPFANRL